MLLWARVLGLAFLGWGAWLSFPVSSSAQDAQPGLTAAVLDVSASATRRRTGFEVRALRDVLTAALAAEERGDDFLLVTYAADVRRVFGPAPAAEAVVALRSGEGLRLTLPAERTLESRLAAALVAVEQPLVEPNRGPSRLILRAGDSYTGAEPGSTLARLNGLGVSIETLAMDAPDQADLALARFEVPRRLELGAQATARVEIVAEDFDRTSHSAQLELELEFAGETQRRTLELPSLASGSHSTTHFVDLGLVRAGMLEVRARVALKDLASGYSGDRIPENDRAQAQLQSRSTLTCVVVTDEEAKARDWIGPVPAGLEFRFVAPQDVGNELERADLCVCIDRAPGELDAELLGTFVRSGGGLLVAGGWALLSNWDSERARPAAELLPLALAESSRPPRDVQFIVDGSGSMSGAPFQAVREAMIKLVPSTPANDRVSLRFFTGALQPRTVLSQPGTHDSETREARARELLAETVPGGQTLLVDSLEQLAKEREGSEEEALVLVLSDGHESNSFNAFGRAAQLVERFAATRTTLRMIAVGDEPGLRLLRALLPAGTEPTRVLDFAGLDEVFQRSVNEERVETGPLTWNVPAVAQHQLASGLAAALRGGPLPRVGRVLLTREREGATVLARSPSGNPVLAMQRVGLGVSAFLATGPGADWCGELRLGTHCGALLRRLGRDSRPDRAPRFRAGQNLVLENVPLDWPARLRARVVRPQNRGEAVLGEFRLELTAETTSEDPRSLRNAEWPDFLDSVASGTTLAVDVLDENDESLSRLALVAPGPPEFVRAVPFTLPTSLVKREGAANPPQAGAAHPFAPVSLVIGLVLSMLAALGQSRVIRSLIE